MNYFIQRKDFKSEEERYKSFKLYSKRTNNIARKVLGFKTPNEMVKKRTFQKAALIIQAMIFTVKARYALRLDRNIYCLYENCKFF